MFTRQPLLLGDLGFTPDMGTVERIADDVVFYHYTSREHVAAILHPEGGLCAQRRAGWADMSGDVVDAHIAEGFLDPLPRWLEASPYFDNLGMELMRSYIGDLLLRIRVPATLPGIYVVDYAHALECKHVIHRGRPGLGLGHDCRTGRDATEACFRSRVPLAAYEGGHLAPTVEVVRQGPGVCIPRQFIEVAATQPLHDLRSNT